MMTVLYAAKRLSGLLSQTMINAANSRLQDWREDN